jgi:hypothetical protein
MGERFRAFDVEVNPRMGTQMKFRATIARWYRADSMFLTVTWRSALSVVAKRLPTRASTVAIRRYINL